MSSEESEVGGMGILVDFPISCLFLRACSLVSRCDFALGGKYVLQPSFQSSLDDDDDGEEVRSMVLGMDFMILLLIVR